MRRVHGSVKVGDIDSQRMALRVEQGKGRKDRLRLAAAMLLQRLRVWLRVGHAQGKIPGNGWLFPGLNPMDPLSTRRLNRAVHAAADADKIDKRESMHTLRHSFAKAAARRPGGLQLLPQPALPEVPESHG